MTSWVSWLFALLLGATSPTTGHVAGTSSPVQRHEHVARAARVQASADDAAAARAVMRKQRRPHLLRGADISWPNCPKGMGIPSRRSQGQPMPRRSARFVVVGVTNGPAFYPNPCITTQVSWVHRHHRLLAAYAMTTYPRAKQIRRYGRSGPFHPFTRLARLSNTGYAEAVYNDRTMRVAGLHTHRVWVDVEPYPTSPWTRHRARNRAVVTGAIRGYHELGYDVGIYTYANGWHDVVGSWRLAKYPAWVTAGARGMRSAAAMCRYRGPSGGRAWLAQWWDTHHDYDLRCPHAPRQSKMFR